MGARKDRAYPRFSSHQKVSLWGEGLTTRFPGLMKNVSLGGAYVETEASGVSFVAGDRLQLYPEESTVKETDFLDCQVIWKKDLEGGSTAYGLSFVDLDQAFELFFQHWNQKK
ncbi:MAG: PilZ domain-containing protein [Bdellovibrio sp.]